MASFRPDDDIFSPVRFDSSLADSINSGGSITNIEMGLSFKEFSHNMFPDSELEDQKNIFSPTLEGLKMDKITKKSSISISPLASCKDSSRNSKKVSTDMKMQSLSQKRISRDKNSFSKENIKNDKNQHKERESKEIDLMSSAEQSDIKVKKPIRPTSLLPMDKIIETNTLKDIKKIQNKSAKKSSLSKNMKGAGACEKNSVNLSQRDSLNEKSVDVAKNINSKRCEDPPLKKVQTKNRPVSGLQNVKSAMSQQSDSKPASSKLQSEDKVIEKMVHDYISFECDKVRQNIYSQQMLIYREINKIKDNMEREHLATTDRLCKMIEELLHANVSLKEHF